MKAGMASMNRSCNEKPPVYTKREIRNVLRRELKLYEACVGDLTPE